MNITIDKKRYSSLLEEAQPQVIKTEEAYARALEQVEALIEAEELSPEQEALLDLLATLIEAYEAVQYPTENSTPLEVLSYLMEVREMKQSDLAEIIGSKGHASEILNGKRGISKSQAYALGEAFHVSHSLFI
ncbi:helix-turn-helix domain-containing protein [Cyanobacteria bacterium FACHB-63]|nr:helix-turn-helix domain-containing protein [Cyanobacteria bacterium FACHB-63]